MRVFRISTILPTYCKNSLDYYKAGAVIVNSIVVGSSAGQKKAFYKEVKYALINLTASACSIWPC
jgi:hypothetical protein